MASRKFGVIIFSIASALYWSFLVSLLTGVMSARHYGDWLAAFGGSLFFPGLAGLSWHLHVPEQTQAAEEVGSREIRADRKHHEIQRFLVKRVNIVEAEDVFRGKTEVPAYLPVGENDLPFFREFTAQHLAADDELWIYDSGVESWDNLAGCSGFAIVRQGKVVAFHEVAEN